MKKINLCSPIIGTIEKRAVRRCLDSGFVSSAGPLITEFEQAFARRVGARHAVATASGTAAIHTALIALDLQRRQSVVVPDLTFVASLNPVLYCGAAPLTADVLSDTWTLDPDVFQALCRRPAGQRPRAVIPVHLYGSACDMPAIRAIARRYRVAVIEDATEALGTLIHGRYAGTWGDIGCFSFNGNKMITTGGGGMLVTDSARLARRARHLVNQARTTHAGYRHDMVGYNYRMTNLTAALGLAQMQRLDGILRAKRRIAERYTRAFAGRRQIRICPEPPGITNCHWLYSILLPSAAARAGVARRLSAAGIPCRPFFSPLHKQPYLRQRLWTMRKGRLTACAEGCSDRLAARGLSLPSSPEMRAAEQQHVIDTILRALPAGKSA